MATLTAPGLGSGLDIKSIISQLMSIERQPVVRLDERKTAFKAQISGYGQLKSVVSTFKSSMTTLSSLAEFKTYKASSSADSVVTATASSAAAPGSYAVTVNALASRHKLNSTGYTDAATVVGTGTLTINVGTQGSFAVTIDGTNNTLGGIRTAINNATDNTGVTATIVTASGLSHLVLTSNESGVDNALTVTVTGDGDLSDTDPAGLSALATTNLNQITPAVDASITVDSLFTATSASNTITGVIEGVTFNAVAVGSASVEVARDNEAVTKSVQTLVDAYNKVRSTISTLEDSSLRGDSTMRSVTSRLLGVLNVPPTGLTTSLESLADVGITTQRDGSLSLDKTVLDAALSTDFNGVSQLFANDNQGYAYRFSALATELLEADGIVYARENGLNARIRTIDDRKAQLEFRLEKVEKRLLAQFTALDGFVSKMQATGSFLSRQLG